MKIRWNFFLFSFVAVVFFFLHCFRLLFFFLFAWEISFKKKKKRNNSRRKFQFCLNVSFSPDLLLVLFLVWLLLPVLFFFSDSFLLLLLLDHLHLLHLLHLLHFHLRFCSYVHSVLQSGGGWNCKSSLQDNFDFSFFFPYMHSIIIWDKFHLW